MKKIKDYIKKNPEPAKGRFGVNPHDPWSVKYGVAEDLTTKNVGDSRSKVAHSPTLQRAHELEKSVKFHQVKNPPGSMHKKESNQNTSLTPEEVEMNEAKTKSKRMSGADRFRKYLADRDKEHKKFMDSIKDKPHHEYMQAMMDKIRANLNKEQISKPEAEKFHKKLDTLVHSTFGKRPDEKKLKEESGHKVGDSVTVHSKFFGKQKGKVTKVDSQSVHVQRDGKKFSEKYPHDAVIKEEAEQIEEKKGYGESDPLQNRADYATKNKPGQVYKPIYPGDKSGMSKSYAYDIKRTGPKGKLPEETYMDAKAATPAVMSPGEGISEKMTTAKRIMALKKKVVKEDLFDHEKEDKSVSTYGKKPKMDKPDMDKNVGENKPSAAVIMSGGKTLTGSKRDTIEIDPMMRNRPGQPDAMKKQDSKKDK